MALLVLVMTTLEINHVLGDLVRSSSYLGVVCSSRLAFERAFSNDIVTFSVAGLVYSNILLICLIELLSPTWLENPISLIFDWVLLQIVDIISVAFYGNLVAHLGRVESLRNLLGFPHVLGALIIIWLRVLSVLCNLWANASVLKHVSIYLRVSSLPYVCSS